MPELAEGVTDLDRSGLEEVPKLLEELLNLFEKGQELSRKVARSGRRFRGMLLLIHML